MAFSTAAKLQHLDAGVVKTLSAASGAIDADQIRIDQIHINSGGLSFHGTGENAPVLLSLSNDGNFFLSGALIEIDSTVQLHKDNVIVVSSGPSGLQDGGIIVEQFNTAWGSHSATGTAQAGSDSTRLKLTGTDTAIDNGYTNFSIAITGGTGAGQQRTISSNVAATKFITVERAWDTTPDNTSVYKIYSTTAPRYMGMVWDASDSAFRFAQTRADVGSGPASFGNNADVYLATLNATGDAIVSGALGVSGASTLASASISGAVTVGTTLGVSGASTLASAGISGALTVGTTLAVSGASTLTGNVAAAGTLAVTGASTLTGNVSAAGTLAVTGASTLASAGVTNALTVGGTLAVTGASTLTGNVAAAGTLAVTGASTLTGNVSAAGTLAVTGASTLTGAVTMTAGFDSNAASTAHSLNLDGGNSSSYLQMSSNSAINAPVVNRSLYVRSNELCYRNNDGTEIQITSDGGINVGEIDLSGTSSDSFVINNDAAGVVPLNAQLIVKSVDGTGVDVGALTYSAGGVGTDNGTWTIGAKLSITGQVASSGDVVVSQSKSIASSGWNTLAAAKGEVVYASAASTVGLADADASSASKIIGVVNDSGEVVHCGPCDFRMDAGGCSAGDRLYASATAGRVTATAPSSAAQYVAPVGIALAAIDANATGRGIFMREPATLLS